MCVKLNKMINNPLDLMYKWTMRPNIDLSNKVHGEIKDFADQKNISVNEGYSKILKRGLRVEKPVAIFVGKPKKPFEEGYPESNPTLSEEDKEKMEKVYRKGGSIVHNAKLEPDRGYLRLTNPVFISHVEAVTETTGKETEEECKEE